MNEIVPFLNAVDFDGAIKIAQTLSKSQLVPKDYQNHPSDIIVAMAWGAELGLPPLAAIQNIAVINGRPSLWGDAVLGLIKSKSDFEYIKESFDEKTMTATCVIKRRNEPECVALFSKRDAEIAGLWSKIVWKSYPRRMLQMRARGFAIRDAFPHHLKGLALAEEMQDIPPAPLRPEEISDPLAPAAQPEEIIEVPATPVAKSAADPLAVQSMEPEIINFEPEQPADRKSPERAEIDRIFEEFIALGVEELEILLFLGVQDREYIMLPMLQTPEFRRFYKKCRKDFQRAEQ